MKIVAKTIKGKEFMYSIRTAHKVNGKKADLIATTLNDCGYLLKAGEVWHVYDIDEYSGGYGWAEVQSFYFSKSGYLKRRAYA